MPALVSHPVPALTGTCPIPGDKSISHRALIVGACATDETTIDGLLEADDVLATATALRSMGVEINQGEDGQIHIWGRGVGGLSEPSAVLDLGNSGTGARLLMGIVASHPFTAVLAGDRSLSARPMRRVIQPLSQMGATIFARQGDRLPATVLGNRKPMPLRYESPVASAQVKSAVLLAALNAPGETTLVEPAASRDHTERILADFGADVMSETSLNGSYSVTIRGEAELTGRRVSVPKDISSAAFPLVAALITAHSRVALDAVGVNPLRVGLLETLSEMGARLKVTNHRTAGQEPVADLTAESSELRGVVVPARRVPAMIDEIPILAIAAACAQGITRLEGIAELRVKESDRVRAIARGLERCGVRVEEGCDWLVVHGRGCPPPGGARVEVEMDHRIAMAFLVLGCASGGSIAVDDGSPIATSFPGFDVLMNRLGARIMVPEP